MNEQTEFIFLKSHPLMKGLSDEQISLLQKKLTQVHYNPNDVIIEEGESSSDVYFIAEGGVSVLKWDEKHFTQEVLDKLGPGETIGEIAFLEPSLRSTTVKAIKPSTLLKLSRNEVSSAEMSPILNILYANIALINANRLRSLNERYAKHLQTFKRLTEQRHSSGEITLYQYVVLCLSVSAATFFPVEFRLFVPWMIAVIPCVMIMKMNQQSWSKMGLNLRNLPSVLATTLLALVSVLIVAYAINLALLNQLSPKHASEWMLRMNFKQLLGIAPLTWLFYALYCFCFELVARGIMQSSIQDFFQDIGGLKSNLVNATFLSIFTLPLGLHAAFSVFLISLPLGYFFRKQKTILGCFLIHFTLLILGLISL